MTTVHDKAPQPPRGLTRISDILSQTFSRLTPDLPAISLIVTLFLAKSLIADRRSYWMDELISVWITGVGQETFARAMHWFIRDGNHPPVYEVTLYGWMMVFGDSEISTRTLSNLFVALATVFLYLLVRVGFSRLTAFISIALFSFSSLAVDYSLETRSYGLFFLVVVFSTYLVALWIRASISHANNGGVAPSGALTWWIFVANSAVLGTHYFGIFFLAVQLVFVGIFVLKVFEKKWLTIAKKTLYWLLGPIGVFLVLWGWVFLPTLQSSGARHAIDGTASMPPWDIYLSSLVYPIFTPHVLGIALSVAVVILVAVGVVQVLSAKAGTISTSGWLTVLLGLWLFLPFVFIFVAFSIIGAEQYSPRYFLFALPPLFPLIAIGIDKVARLAFAKKTTHPLRSVFSVAVATVLVVSLLPSTHSALSSTRGDYRDVAEEIIYYADTNPGLEFAVFEVARGHQSKMNYYFERRDTILRSAGNFPLYEENAADFDILRKDKGGIREADRIVIAFPFDRIAMFPNLHKQLEEEFDVVFVRETVRGTGFVVYAPKTTTGIK